MILQIVQTSPTTQATTLELWQGFVNQLYLLIGALGTLMTSILAVVIALRSDSKAHKSEKTSAEVMVRAKANTRSIKRVSRKQRGLSKSPRSPESATADEQTRRRHREANGEETK